jgi:beta-phosphoglucomutase-like phosphatase (HAD superfamily)
MDRFPPWLPKEVKEHAEHLIEVGGLNTAKPLLMRLVTHLEMEKVWKTLSSKSNQSQQLIDFLEFVRLHASLQGDITSPITIPSDKTQRAIFKKVSDASQVILHSLEDLSQSSDAQEGFYLLESALMRAELDAAEREDSEQLALIKGVQNSLQDLQQHDSIVTFLASITAAARLAASAPDMMLPKRRNTERAKCNHLILDLKSYLKSQFSITQSDTLIATIVNAAFEFPDVIITADDVRKLKP